jgi:hypothetical protein
MPDLATITAAAAVATALVALWRYLSGGECDCPCCGECNQGRGCPMMKDHRHE